MAIEVRYYSEIGRLWGGEVEAKAKVKVKFKEIDQVEMVEWYIGIFVYWLSENSTLKTPHTMCYALRITHYGF